MPVRDESRHLRAAVAGVIAQDYPGGLEVVLAVAPSADDTRALADLLAREDPRVQVVDNASGLTPAGLNAAIRACRGEVVARVDGHAELPQGYLRRAVELLEQTGAVNVGGIMGAEGVTPFERAVAAAMSSPFGVGNGRFHYGGEPGPADTVYLGVFRRSALEAAGGYDESFLRAQDWELNHRLRGAGGVVWFTPELRVTYRPRSSLRAVASQYFNYGRWRRIVMRRHPDSVRLRYLVPPAAVVAMSVGAVVGLAGRRVGWLLPAGYVAAVLAASAVTGRRLQPAVAARLPAVFATMHLAWGTGFLTSSRRLGARPMPPTVRRETRHELTLDRTP